MNFYWDFFSQGKPAHVPIQHPSLVDTVDIILNTGGIPILAHPGQNTQEDEKLLSSIFSCGVCGLEAISSYHDKAQVDFYLAYAEAHGLLVTCGSDFHGNIKPSIHVGRMDTRGRETEISLLANGWVCSETTQG